MENVDLDGLFGKVGGKFALTVMVQRRIRELQQGSAPLVDIRTEDPWQIAAEEIRAGRLVLVTGERAEKLRQAEMRRMLEAGKVSAGAPEQEKQGVSEETKAV